MAEIKYVSQQNLSAVLTKIKATFVAKETGKSLISDELITKLNGIAAGAQVNVIETVKVNGTALEVADKAVNVVVPTKISDLGTVTESDLAAGLKEKVNAAAEGNHSHANKALLDTYTQTEADLADAVAKKHAHANAAELALIASGDKSKWDAAAADTATIKADYLKTADKYDDTALKGRVAAIEADYLKEADKYDDTELAGRVTAVEGKVETLVGDDANKSARTIAAEETAKIVAGAGTSFDTLKEIADWISTHGTDATAMNSAIVALQNQLKGIDDGEGTVKKYVDDAITALKIGDYAKASDLTALAGRVTVIENTLGEKSELFDEGMTVWEAINRGNLATEAIYAQVVAIAADYVKASEMVALTDAEIEAIWAAA